VTIRRLGVLSVFALLVQSAVLFSASFTSADEWKPVTPEELKMTGEPLAPGAPAIYLYRQVDRNDNGQATTEYNYIRIKILTEEGRQSANIEIPFSKGEYGVSGIRARTFHPDGSIVNFDGKVYESTIVKSKTLKYLAKTFTMPDVTVGSIIEYHFNYDFADNYIFDSRWIISGELFTKHAEFTLKPYTSEGWTVSWISPAGLPQGTQPAKEGTDGIIRMTSDNIPAFQTEDYMPPENELKFRVNFVYSMGIPETDQAKYWKNFDKKNNGNIEHFVGKKKEMEEAVAQIVSPGDSPEVKLQKIYARVQQLRNLNYETSKTAEEEKREKIKAASNVEDVWKNGFGSGYDITWLFMGLARAAGIEAHPCLVSSRSEYFFRKERMNGQELNTNVVLVKLDGKDIYLDPGAEYTPFGLLPWTETGVAGMELDNNGGTWIQTTLPDSTVSQIQRDADLKLTDDGTLQGKLTITYSGLEALSRRLDERNEDDVARKKYLQDEVKEDIPLGSTVELTNKPEWSSSAMTLVAQFDIKVPGWLTGAGHRALCPAGLFIAPEKHMFEHANRVYPVYFAYPYKKFDDLKIALPLGWQVSDVPKPFDQNAKAAEYSLKVEDDKGTLLIQRELRSDLVLLPQNVYPVLRNFYQIVRNEDEQQIILQPGRASASN
jgi:hypothetical protein